MREAKVHLDDERAAGRLVLESDRAQGRHPEAWRMPVGKTERSEIPGIQKGQVFKHCLVVRVCSIRHPAKACAAKVLIERGMDLRKINMV